MTVTTISVTISVGSKVYTLSEVGDPKDLLFLMQISRSVAVSLLGHEED